LFSDLKRTEPNANTDSKDEKNLVEEEGASSKKKSWMMSGKNQGISPPFNIDDAEFTALQAHMFGDKGKSKKERTSS
jgi:hypothetical protein